MNRILITLVIAFSTSPAGIAQPAGYTQNAVLKINHTKVANSDQANFPLFVAGTDASLKSTNRGGRMYSTSGYDILFTSDATGTNALQYERGIHDTQSGRIAYWVKLPILSHSIDTPIYVWYGNPSITTDQSVGTAVWDTNYKAVWHMNDNAQSFTVADSTGNGHNGTNQAPTQSRSVAGALANLNGLSYSGSSDYTNVPSSNGSDLDLTTGNVTVEFWLKLNAYVTYAAYFGNGIWNHTGYYLQENGGGHGLALVANFSNTFASYNDTVNHGVGAWMHIGVGAEWIVRSLVCERGSGSDSQ